LPRADAFTKCCIRLSDGSTYHSIKSVNIEKFKFFLTLLLLIILLNYLNLLTVITLLYLPLWINMLQSSLSLLILNLQTLGLLLPSITLNMLVNLSNVSGLSLILVMISNTFVQPLIIITLLLPKRKEITFPTSSQPMLQTHKILNTVNVLLHPESLPAVPTYTDLSSLCQSFDKFFCDKVTDLHANFLLKLLMPFLALVLFTIPQICYTFCLPLWKKSLNYLLKILLL
jgi:hypothetical protein